MTEITKDQLIEQINSNNIKENGLFVDILEEEMDELVSCLSRPELGEKGYLLIDFDADEVKHVEDMIEYTSQAYQDNELKDIKAKIAKVQQQMNELDAAIAEASYPAAIKALKGYRVVTADIICNLSQRLTKAKESSELTHYLIKSAIAEQYVIGRIVKELVKVPELADKYSFCDVEKRLEYFEEFLKKPGIEPEEYSDFNAKRFSLITETPPLLQWFKIGTEANDLTCCFTNFQNVSDPVINRVINNFTMKETKKFQTLIFTTASNMLTRECRDEGVLSPCYEYQRYTLNKANRPESKLMRLL